jgi:hypothetical protein
MFLQTVNKNLSFVKTNSSVSHKAEVMDSIDQIGKIKKEDQNLIKGLRAVQNKAQNVLNKRAPGK